MTAHADPILFRIANNGGSLDVSLFEGHDAQILAEAEQQGLVHQKATGWGDRTVAVLTPKGRQLTGVKEEASPLLRFLAWIARD